MYHFGMIGCEKTMYTDFSLMLITIRLLSVKLRVRIYICIVRNHSLLKSGSPCDWLTSISCRSAVIQLLNFLLPVLCFIVCLALVFVLYKMYMVSAAERSQPSLQCSADVRYPCSVLIKYKIMTSQ